MFPGATHVLWAKQFAVYLADFYHDGHEKQAQFDSAGTWLRTRAETSIYEVPPQVLKTAREFSDWKIDDVFLFEQSNGAAAYYMVEYTQGTSFFTKQLLILKDGTILAAI